MRKLQIFIFTALALSSLIAFSSNKKETEMALNRSIVTFNQIMNELQLNYVDSLNPDKLLQDAINGMFYSLDPYTTYYNSDEQEQIVRMTTGDYGGIGSYIAQIDGKTYISEPMPGSPALEAGLKGGDHILRVDSLDVSKMGSEAVTKLLRGVPGTNVTVTVFRPYSDTDSILTVNIERKKLHESSVKYSRMFDNGIGYVRLESFIDKTPDEMRTVLNEFKKDKNFKGLVIDLRDNGGGLLESAIELAGFFLPKGTEVVRTKGRTSKNEKIYRTTRNPILPDIPLAFIINNGSASASEILAGTMQDLDRAVLIGERSYGKGLVQSTRPLPFEGLLKLTTAKYYIPSGRLVQALDYSHRNPDGSVARTPDSLTNVFHTRNGREVRDGGGLVPDISIKSPAITPLIYKLVTDHWIFNYATKFAAKNKEIGSIEDFIVTDDLYNDFKNSIDAEKFNYNEVGDELIKRIREVINSEGYMNEETEGAIKSLALLLQHDLQGDLDLKRDEVVKYLAPEIASRYYPGIGRVAAGLQREPEITKAFELLLNSSDYKKLLRK